MCFNRHQMSAAVGSMGGLELNKIEQVSSNGYHCTVRSNAPWVMVTWDAPVNRMTDKHG